MPSSLPDQALATSRAAATLAASPASPSRSLVWLVGLSHATNHFVMLIFPAVLLLVQQEFGLGYASLGVFANVALLGYGVGALPAGMLADRLGSHRILSIWLVGGSLACLSIGLSAGPVGLVIGLAVLGLFGSLHHPAGSSVLVALRNVGSPEVGRAFGITFTLGFGVGSLASSAMGVIAQRFGLPAVFLSLGMVVAGGVALALSFGHVVGAWSRKPTQPAGAPLHGPHPSGH